MRDEKELLDLVEDDEEEEEVDEDEDEEEDPLANWRRPRKNKNVRRRFKQKEWLVLMVMRAGGSDVEGLLYRIGQKYPRINPSADFVDRAARSFVSSGYAEVSKVGGTIFYKRSEFGDLAVRWAKWFGVIRGAYPGRRVPSSAMMGPRGPLPGEEIPERE